MATEGYNQAHDEGQGVDCARTEQTSILRVGRRTRGGHTQNSLNLVQLEKRYTTTNQIELHTTVNVGLRRTAQHN